MLKCYQEQSQKSNADFGYIRGVAIFGELRYVKTVVNLLSIWDGPDSKGKHMKKMLACCLMNTLLNCILILAGLFNNPTYIFMLPALAGQEVTLVVFVVYVSNYSTCS